jgi:hypothetical protein
MDRLANAIEIIIEICGALWYMLKTVLVIGLMFGLLFGLVWGCSQADWVKESARRAEAREAAAATPHVIREVDGCKVYEFKAGGHLHYFTRCPKETTTDSVYDGGTSKHHDYHHDTQTIENF